MVSRGGDGGSSNLSFYNQLFVTHFSRQGVNRSNRLDR